VSIMDETPLLYAQGCSKINLYLKITGKRANGYHELESLFLPLADPADDVAVDLDALPGAITVGCSDVLLPGGLENIAGKAADLWAKRSAVMPHWDINIVKNIPVAAGMGGGSSDAAAVLSLLNKHYNCPLSEAELAETALEIGADVPFFLRPQPSVVRGIGEIFQGLDFELPDLPILLAAPNYPVSAAEGYRLLDPQKISPMPPELHKQIMQALQQGDLEKLGTLIFNDLEAGVFNKYPILCLLQQALQASGALKVLMTGSGPTLFALYADHKQAQTACGELQNTYPEFRFIHTGNKK